MTAGMVLGCVSLVGMAAGSTLIEFVLARAVSGIALGLFLPAARASAAGTEQRSIAHHLGRLSSAELSGIVAGPVLGAAIAGVLGLSATFLTFAVLGLTIAAFTGPRLPNRTVPVGPVPTRGVMRLLRRRAVLGALLLVVAIEFPVGMYESVFARYLTDEGASSLFIGFFALAFGLPFVLLAATGGRIADRVGPARAAAFATLVVAPIIASYGFPDRPVVIAGLGVIEACFQAVAIPASRAAMVFACPPEHVAAGQGFAGAAGLFATGVTALVAPLLYETGGPVLMCMTIGGFVAVFALCAIALDRRDVVRV
jgi:DHA1 family multidrug resistance protein-like MFS transporter